MGAFIDELAALPLENLISELFLYTIEKSLFILGIVGFVSWSFWLVVRLFYNITNNNN